jgi:CheY-like chemotaxis protein
MESVEVIVLVVDDDQLLREFMSSALDDGGYKAVLAASVHDADVLLAEHIGALGGLITDIHLGDADQTGWDVARRAREANPSLPIVYVTGTHGDEWASHGVPHSVLLRKPFTSTDLLVALAGLRKTD